MSESKLTVNRLFPYQNKSTLAFADIDYDGIIITGFRVVKRKDGSKFVSYPSEANKEGEWFPTVYPRKGNKELNAQISKAILEKYDDAMASQGETADEEVVEEVAEEEGGD
jgi:DNA-binding cell septation regulator SpoVG